VITTELARQRKLFTH